MVQYCENITKDYKFSRFWGIECTRLYFSRICSLSIALRSRKIRLWERGYLFVHFNCQPEYSIQPSLHLLDFFYKS